jgi:SPP1 family predicted phage head-tail adaptor
MARAGQMRDRITLQRETEVSDGGGGYELGWFTVATVWGQLMPERGNERVENGRMEASVGAVLRIRYSSDVAEVSAGWRAVVDGEEYNIRSVTQPDRRNRIIEMTVDRGVAV